MVNTGQAIHNVCAVRGPRAVLGPEDRTFAWGTTRARVGLAGFAGEPQLQLLRMGRFTITALLAGLKVSFVQGREAKGLMLGEPPKTPVLKGQALTAEVAQLMVQQGGGKITEDLPPANPSEQREINCLFQRTNFLLTQLKDGFGHGQQANLFKQLPQSRVVQQGLSLTQEVLANLLRILDKYSPQRR